MDSEIISLLVKMTAAATVVVIASFVTERVGPFIGAMVATLPVSAGPIYVILAIDHGAAFISTAAVTSLATNAATAAFTTAYAVAAQRYRTLPCLLIAAGAWALGAAAVGTREWQLAEALALNVIAFAPAILLTRRFASAAATGAAVTRWYDAPARGLGVALLAGTVTLTSWQFGPATTGLFAAFPVVFTSLIVILQPRIGGAATAAMFVNGLRGLIGFAGALSMVHVVSPLAGAAAGLAAALAVSVGWNILLVFVSRRKRV